MTPSPRISREQRTIEAMLRIFCRDHHHTRDGLCDDCGKLLDYAKRRLTACLFQEHKPACNRCQVHCYSKRMQGRVKTIMRYAGPRMLLRHPVLSLFHLLDNQRDSPAIEEAKHPARLPAPEREEGIADGGVPMHRKGLRESPTIAAEPGTAADRRGRGIRASTSRRFARAPRGS